MQILQVNKTAQFFNSGEELPIVSYALWLIVSGVVKTHTISDEGVSITLGFWGAKDVIGNSLSIVRPYLCECVTDVEVISIPQHQWGNVFNAILSHGQQTQKMMCIVRSQRIHQRLWLMLQWLTQKFGRNVKEGILIDFQITHQDLADAIGTTRITVTKSLNRLERDGLIVRPKNKCIVLVSS